ncbi:MAG: DUF5989 family protein [Myxococcota bacterium]
MATYVMTAVVVVIVVGLFIERKPGGGFRLSRRLELLREFWTFIKEEKAWWMSPILLILITLGIFIVMAEKSSVMPLIYMLF